MKKLSKKFTIFTFTALLVFAFSLSLHKSTLAQTSDNAPYLGIPALIHRGAGHQYIKGALKLVQNTGGGTVFDTLNNAGKPAVFAKPKKVDDSFFMALAHSLISGRVFVGVPRGGDGFDLTGELSGFNPWKKMFQILGSPSFTAPLQKINVRGGVLSTDLIHTQEDDHVCISKEGTLIMCSTHVCTGAVPQHAEICAGDHLGLSADTPRSLVTSCTPDKKCEYTCATGYHYDNGTCVRDVTYHWETGVWGNCTEQAGTCSGTWTTNTGSCVGPVGECSGTYEAGANGPEPCSDFNGDEAQCNDIYGCSWLGGDVCTDYNTQNSCLSESGCRWNSTSTTHQCSDKSGTDQQSCENYNSACSWTAGGATETRSVTCVDSNGNMVADSYCSGTKPDDTRNVNSCGTQSQISTAVCGIGTYNTAECESGEIQNIEWHSENCTSNGIEYTTWECVDANGLSVSCTSPTCFIANTKVLMADGTHKNIQDVRVGEYVMGRDGEKSMVRSIHKPKLGERRDNKIYAFNGGRYFVTAEHPFLTTDGWKAIDPVWSKEEHPEMSSITHLKVGDVLITEKGKVKIESIDYEERDPDTQLYNLKLGGDHTYFADGYLVHNNKCATN